MGAGMDIVSGGELYRALVYGVDPQKIVYSGVGKRASEIEEALKPASSCSTWSPRANWSA